ncbi:MAG: methylamine utilization protein [Fimbriimonadaceae bacterium]
MTPIILATIVAGNRLATLSGTVTLSNGRAAGHAVVFLDGAERAKPLKRAVIDQRDRKFIPHISVVTLGTRVDFPNHDTVFHNVFTEYHSERFDLGMYARGRSKSQVFDRPGLAVLLCSIHSEMSAYVMCVATPYYAVADGKGSFTIPNIKPGTYTLRIWHESGEKLSETLQLDRPRHLTLKTLR